MKELDNLLKRRENIKLSYQVDLKPCPFCGSTYIRKFHDFGTTSISCSTCGASFKITHEAEDKMPEFVTKWNRRSN